MSPPSLGWPSSRATRGRGLLRTAWANPREAYGARRAALRGLVAWKVKDADDLLAAALKIPADHHSIAATALRLMLGDTGPKARELAVLFQPLRPAAGASLRGDLEV